MCVYTCAFIHVRLYDTHTHNVGVVTPSESANNYNEKHLKENCTS